MPKIIIRVFPSSFSRLMSWSSGSYKSCLGRAIRNFQSVA